MFKIFQAVLLLLNLVCFATSRSIAFGEKVVISEELPFSNDPNTGAFERILEANKGSQEKNQLYEGDIKLNVFRNAHGSKWPKSRDGFVRIAYAIEDVYNSQNRSMIQNTFDTFHKHTCLRFLPRKYERQYLSIENRSSCWSYIGRTTIRKQTVALSIPRCLEKGFISHELMHAVGFRHEHSRSDRDDYIHIISENVDNADIGQFRKFPNTKNLVVYDYTSILHYPQNAFAKHSFLNTIEILPKRDIQPKIGFRNQLSAYDIEEIKYHYNCGSGTYNRCGRDFFNQRRGSFQSPNYPRVYPKESHCTWNITVGQRKVVKITFSGIELEDSAYCQLDAIIVHDGSNAGSPVLMKICGTRSQIEVTSTGNKMFIIFTSDPTREMKGFRASFAEVSSVPHSTSEPLTPTETNTVDEFMCNFDKDMCGMMRDVSAKVDFRLHQAPTPTNHTGPSSDHTTGDGKYIYLESSNADYDTSRGVIRTPWMRSPGRLCIKFSYHMYGKLMGGLRLYAYEKRISENEETQRLLWEKFEDHGNQWHTTNYQFSPQGKLEHVQFHFEGYIPHYTSDIALDDIEITKGYCGFSNRFKARRFRPFFKFG